MKVIAAAFLFFGLCLVGAAKTYEITVEACEIGSSCSRCVERNTVTFEVDKVNKTVIASGIAFDGLPVREGLNDCRIQDESNWFCRSAHVTFEATDGVINLSNTRRENAVGKHEVCQVK